MLLVSRRELVAQSKRIPHLCEVLAALDDGLAEGVPPLPRPGEMLGGPWKAQCQYFATSIRSTSEK